MADALPEPVDIKTSALSSWDKKKTAHISGETTTEALSLDQTKSTDTFTLFQRLAVELRLEIWKFSIEPRLMLIKTNKEDKCTGLEPINSRSTPSILHACKESREVGLQIYQKIPNFPTIQTIERFAHKGPYLYRPYESYANFQRDTIMCLSYCYALKMFEKGSHLGHFSSVSPDTIRHLKPSMVHLAIYQMQWGSFMDQDFTALERMSQYFMQQQFTSLKSISIVSLASYQCVRAFPQNENGRRNYQLCKSQFDLRQGPCEDYINDGDFATQEEAHDAEIECKKAMRKADLRKNYEFYQTRLVYYRSVFSKHGRLADSPLAAVKFRLVDLKPGEGSDYAELYREKMVVLLRDHYGLR